MPIITPSQALLIGFIVAPILFIVSAYFTHASRRHILGAVVGASLYAALNYVWDRAAATYIDMIKYDVSQIVNALKK